MSARLGSGRWSDVTEEAQPFGMPFVDIVASALICMVALLILWLQFIDPLGLIPGQQKQKVLLSLLVQWPNETNREPIYVRVQCGEDYALWINSNVDGYAARTIRINRGSTDCRVSAMSNDADQGTISVSTRTIADGKQVYAANVEIGGEAQNVLSGSREPELRNKLGKMPDERWPFKWQLGKLQNEP
jgi:hypothetical protein